MMNFTATENNMKKWSLTDIFLILGIIITSTLNYYPLKLVINELKDLDKIFSLSFFPSTQLIVNLGLLGVLIIVGSILSYYLRKNGWKYILVLGVLVSALFFFLNEVYTALYIMGLSVGLSYINSSKPNIDEKSFWRKYEIAKRTISLLLLVFFVLLAVYKLPTHRTYSLLFAKSLYNQSLMIFGENTEKIQEQYKAAMLQVFAYGYNISCYDLVMYYQKRGEYGIAREIVDVCKNEYSGRIKSFEKLTDEYLQKNISNSWKVAENMIESIVERYSLFIFLLLVFLGYSILSFIVSILLAPILAIILYILPEK